VVGVGLESSAIFQLRSALECFIERSFSALFIIWVVDVAKLLAEAETTANDGCPC